MPSDQSPRCRRLGCQAPATHGVERLYGRLALLLDCCQAHMLQITRSKRSAGRVTRIFWLTGALITCEKHRSCGRERP
jgi:hypothetical protein